MPEFDLEDFNAKWEASQVEEDEVIEDDEIIEDDTLEDDEVVTEGEEELTPEVEGDPNLEGQSGSEVDSVEAKRNAAFASMRRELEESKKVSTWLASVAEQNGTTPEEMMENYQKALLQKQSEQENVPVEVLQRLKAIEDENSMLKQSTFTERFEAQVLKTKSDFNASEDDLDVAFKYAHDNGLVEAIQQGKMSFDALYKVAHLDTITERKVQEALQSDLSKKKKRQQEAPLPNGSSAAPTDESLDDRAKRDAARFIADGF